MTIEWLIIIQMGNFFKFIIYDKEDLQNAAEDLFFNVSFNGMSVRS
jgi:hypothetical protein